MVYSKHISFTFVIIEADAGPIGKEHHCKLRSEKWI